MHKSELRKREEILYNYYTDLSVKWSDDVYYNCREFILCDLVHVASRMGYDVEGRVTVILDQVMPDECDARARYYYKKDWIVWCRDIVHYMRRYIDSL